MAKELAGLAITNRGAEDVCAQEIEEICSARITEKKETAILFSAKDYSGLCALAYRTQSAHRIMLLLGTCRSGDTLEEAKANINSIVSPADFSTFLSEKTSFKVEARREGEHSYNSVDAATETAHLIIAAIKGKCGFSPVISMDAPDVIFYLYIYGRDTYFGVDFCGIDISKRDYKISSHPESLKAAIAYSLVRLSGFKHGLKLYDPFCGSGMIPIEAAIFESRLPVNFYRKNKMLFSKYKFTGIDFEAFFKKQDSQIRKEDISVFGSDIQLRHMSASQKNAKIAGVSKYLKLTRIDIEWLDTKFEDNSIDLIVSDPPQDSKIRNTGELERLYNELFHQAGYVLSKKGSMLLLARSPELIEAACKKHKFIIDSKKEIYSGKQKFDVFHMKRDD